MQKKKQQKIAGFAGENQGNIKNCYSVMTIRGKSSLTAGFVADNSSSVQDSYSYSALKNLTGGFSGKDTGEIAQCYFFYTENGKHKNLADHENGVQLKSLKKMEDYRKLGFDTGSTWNVGYGAIPLQFNARTWNYGVPEEDGEKIRQISSAEELRTFAQQVNEGSRESREAHVRLTQDIDLKGKEWISIGREAEYAF